MELFKEHTYDLSNAFPAKPGKRFASFFIDFSIVLIGAILLFLGAAPIAKRTASYQQATAKVEEEISYYNNYAEASGLVSFVDEEKTIRKSDEIIVIENINRAIMWSYEKFGNAQYPDFVIEDGSETARYGKASPENDSIAHFYTIYVPQEAEESGTPILSFASTPLAYVNSLYKSSCTTGMFRFDAVQMDENGHPTELPALHTDVSRALYCYMTDNTAEEMSAVYEAGKAYFNNFYNAYSTMLIDAENSLVRNEPYYSTHYLAYRQAVGAQAKCFNIALILSFFLSYLILNLLPKFLFRNERTLGKLILGLGVITTENEEPKWYLTLVHSLLLFIPYLAGITVAYMMPPFNGVFDGMMLPFIGNVSLAVILIGAFILTVINSISTMFTAQAQTLLEMSFKTKLMDEKSIGLISDTEQSKK